MSGACSASSNERGMLMKAYKDCVLITDIDGTLANSDHVVSEQNRAAIHFFKAQGGRFAIATGRTQKTAVTFLEQAKVNAPCVFYNGAVLYDWDKKELIKVKSVKSKALVEFVQYCMKQYPTMCIQIYTIEQIYVITGDVTVDDHLITENHEFEYATLEEMMDKEWAKVMLSDQRNILEECRSKLEAFQLETTTNHFFSAEYYFEFVGKEVSKGTMVADMMQLPEFHGKTVFAAGDFQNDIEMLNYVDVGVAPANAEPDVQAAADVVSVTNNEHLMYEIIYNIMPNHFKNSAKSLRD